MPSSCNVVRGLDYIGCSVKIRLNNAKTFAVQVEFWLDTLQFLT